MYFSLYINKPAEQLLRWLVLGMQQIARAEAKSAKRIAKYRPKLDHVSARLKLRTDPTSRLNAS